MRIIGGIAVLLYGVLTFSHFDFDGADEDRGRVPSEAQQRGPGGAWLWYGGFRGGK